MAETGIKPPIAVRGKKLQQKNPWKAADLSEEEDDEPEIDELRQNSIR